MSEGSVDPISVGGTTVTFHLLSAKEAMDKQIDAHRKPEQAKKELKKKVQQQIATLIVLSHQLEK